MLRGGWEKGEGGGREGELLTVDELDEMMQIRLMRRMNTYLNRVVSWISRPFSPSPVGLSAWNEGRKRRVSESDSGRSI